MQNACFKDSQWNVDMTYSSLMRPEELPPVWFDSVHVDEPVDSFSVRQLPMSPCS